MAGEEQGVYAWVSANYALGTLTSEPQETTGVVELGGTSLQVYTLLSFDLIRNQLLHHFCVSTFISFLLC